jgi:hypothetical protein
VKERERNRKKNRDREREIRKRDKRDKEPVMAVLTRKIIIKIVTCIKKKLKKSELV